VESDVVRRGAELHLIGAPAFGDGLADHQLHSRIVVQYRQCVGSERPIMTKVEVPHEEISCRDDVGYVEIEMVENH
jgi:hypothetical protein